MPRTACPIAGCDFVTADVQDSAERIALLTIHATTHSATAITAKPERVSRPKIASGSSSEDMAILHSKMDRLQECHQDIWRRHQSSTHGVL